MKGDPPHSSDQHPAAGSGPGPLASQEEGWSVLLQNTPRAMAMFDGHMRLLLASQRWLNMFGCDNVRGESFYALIPDYPIAWLTAHHRCLTGVAQSSERDRFVRADGSDLILNWSLSPWFRADDSIGGLIMEAEPTRAESGSKSILTVANRVFRSLYNQIPVMLFSIDRHGLVSDANTHWLEAMGYSASDIVGKPLLDFLTRSSREYVEQVCLPSYRETGTLKDEPLEFVKSTGEAVEMVVSATAKRDSTGYLVDSVVVATDITDLRQAEEKLRQAGSALRMVADAVVIANQSGHVTGVNPAFTRLTGYTEADVAGVSLLSLCQNDDNGNSTAAIQRVLEQEDQWEGKLQLTKREADPVLVQVRIDRVRDSAGRLNHQVMSCEDLSKAQQSKRSIRFLEEHDQLTRLPNRNRLENRLSETILHAGRSQSSVAVCNVDLDRFKTINDSLGHEVGDRILQATARRLTGLVRSEDIVARIGGDDFAVVLQSVNERKDVERFAEKMLDALSNPLRLANYEVCLSASVGISVFPENGASAEALLRNADAAMHRAKEDGGNDFHFYTAELTTTAHKRLSLDTALRRALRNKEFALYYQPQVAVEQRRIQGVEALLRWQHPRSGLLLPTSFLEYAEETGLIVSIGNWVMRRACEQIRSWDLTGVHDLRMAVNVSARQLVEDRFVPSVKDAIDNAHISADRIELEITESIFLKHSEKLLQKLHDLKNLGVTLTIDDFGAGYSSLGYLKHLPVDRLKIDRGFVKDLPEDANDAAIARAIVTLSDSLDLDVVAEGVETEAQFSCLRSMGCHHTQGYLFGRPMDADSVVSQLGLTPDTIEK